MSAAEPPAEPTPPASTDDPAYCLRLLHEMAELGMSLLREIDADTSLPLRDRAEAFDRISRAVRRTILLSLHIAANPANRSPDPKARPVRPTRDAEAARDNRTEPPDRERGERAERVETVDLEPAFFARPIPEIIAEIRHDLGLEDPTRDNTRHRRRTPTDITLLTTRAATPPRTAQITPIRQRR